MMSGEGRGRGSGQRFSPGVGGARRDLQGLRSWLAVEGRGCISSPVTEERKIWNRRFNYIFFLGNTTW